MQIKKLLSLILSAVLILGIIAVPTLAETVENVYLNYQFEENAAEELAAIKAATEGRRSNFATSLPLINTEDGKLVFKGFGNGSSASYMTLPLINKNTTELPELVFEYKVKMTSSSTQYYLGYDSTRFVGDTNFIHTNSTGIAWSQPNVNAGKYIITDDIYGGLSDWHTIAHVYSNTEHTRKLYVDGVYYATSPNNSAAADNYWFNNNKIWFTFKQYTHKSTTDNAQFEYIKIYSPGETVGFKASAETYALDTVYLDFSSSMVDVSPYMVSIGDMYAAKVELIDEEKQIYAAVFPEKLEATSNYTVLVEGATDSLGRTVTGESSFETRELTFYIDGLKVVSGEEEISSLITGDLSIGGSAVNELNEHRTASALAVQYDSEGFMKKENVAKCDIDTEIPSNTPITGDFVVETDTAVLSAFAWENADTPIPVSDVKYYDADGIYEDKLTYGISEYSGEASITAEIKEDYSGLTVIVDTKDTFERLVGLLVQYDGSVEYIANAKTTGGLASFDVPLKEDRVGSYQITAGIENGRIVSLTPDVEYYSPLYIERMMNEKINASEANAESVGMFVSLLGSYLELCSEDFDKVSDKSIAYEKLLNLRSTYENEEIPNQTELAKAFAASVKMALIFEGTDTERLISESTDLAIDETTKNTFSTLISSYAREYVKEKLKNVYYSLPADMTADVKKHTIIGGLYKASHYTLADAFIKLYGTEFGINTGAYLSLANPQSVADRLIKVEYTDFAAFASAANNAIASQAALESVPTPPVPSLGSGGGGGGGMSSTKYSSDEKNEEKEDTEIKEEVPQKSYSDVTPSDWFYNDVSWATKEGWFIGTGDTTFSPERKLTWEQIVIVLERMGHKEENKKGKTEITRGEFADVLYKFLADKKVYSDRDNWISKTKMFIGNENGDMMFEKSLTRAECCTILRRIEGK